MIFASLGLDWANFQRGMQGAMASMQRLAGGASIFAGLTVAAKQFYDAVQLGDELVDLNAQTGVAIDKLMELQMAFDLNGMKADQVQPVLAKMQRLIAEAGAGSAEAAAKFQIMGVAVSDIQGLNADEQLMKIGEAISQISNPAQRSAVAMDIFGKSGAKLLSVFAAGGMDEVRKLLGDQAKLLLDNAGVFGKASDILGLTGSKIRGFFVGIASEIVPQLMDVLEKSSKLDFTQMGVALGKELTGLGLFVKEIVSYFVTAGDFVVSAFSKAAEILFAPAMFMAKLIQGDPDAALARERARDQAAVENNYISKGIAEIQKAQEEARAKNPTPGAAPTGMDILRKMSIGAAVGMPDISSLQKVGGGSALLSGGQDNSPAYQSVRIQEDIRTYIKELIDVVKQGGQDYQIAPAQSGGMVLTA
jgi:hypothetical protein